MDLSTSTRVTFSRDRPTWILYVALGFYAYLETLPGPIMPFLLANLQLTYGIASLHFFAFGLGTVAIGIAGDQVIHWLGRPRSLWGGVAGMGVGVALLVSSPFALGTIGGAGLMGLAGTILLIAIQAQLSDSHGEHRTIALAEANVVAGVCAIFASAAVGLFASTDLGWRASGGLAVIAAIILVSALRTVRNEPVPTRSEPATPIAIGGLPRRFWPFWIVMAFGASVELCVVYWGATFLERGAGFEPATAASTMGIYFAAVVVGRLAGSRLVRLTRSKRVLLLAQGITLIGFLLFWLAPTAIGNALGLFVAGLGIGNFYPLTLASAIAVAPRQVENVSARLTLATGLAGLAAPLVLGRIADVLSIEQAFVVVLPLLVGAMVVLILSKGDVVDSRMYETKPR